MSRRRIGAGIVLALLVALLTGVSPIVATPPEPLATTPVGERVRFEKAVMELPVPLSTEAQTVASIMTQNFEGTWPAAGWQLFDQSTADGGEYKWGKRNCHPHTGTYAGWCIGAGSWGGALDCAANYPNNLRTWAIYGPFDLRGAGSASLSFYFWGRSEYDGSGECNSDFLFVGYSTDGSQFYGGTACGNFTDGDAGNGYYFADFDLSDVLGQSQVWVAFLMISNSQNVYNGFTIDDIVLSRDGSPTPTRSPTRTATVTVTRTPTSTPTATPTLTPSPTFTLPSVVSPTPWPTVYCPYPPCPTVTPAGGRGALYLPLLLRNPVPTPVPCSEPTNDAPGGACGPLVSRAVRYDYIEHDMDSGDWFYFDLTHAPQRIEVRLTGLCTGCDLDLYLYDDPGQHMIGYSGWQGNLDEHIVATGTVTGRYYIWVRRIVYANYAQPYALTADFGP